MDESEVFPVQPPQLASDDDYVNIGGARYFIDPKTRIVCFNCGQRGHIRDECPETAPCFLCGSKEHEPEACISTVCFECQRPGHQKNECPRRQSHSYCLKCDMDGHAEETCPDIWRDYVFAQSPRSLKRPQRWCYNCGRKGHWGDDCRESKNGAPARVSMFSYSCFIDDESLLRRQYKGDNVPANRKRSRRSPSPPPYSKPSSSLARNKEKGNHHSYNSQSQASGSVEMRPKHSPVRPSKKIHNRSSAASASSAHSFSTAAPPFKPHYKGGYKK